MHVACRVPTRPVCPCLVICCGLRRVLVDPSGRLQITWLVYTCAQILCDYAVACAEGPPGPDAATPQAQFQGQLSPEGTPPGPIGAVQAAQAAQNQQVQVLTTMSSTT